MRVERLTSRDAATCTTKLRIVATVDVQTTLTDESIGRSNGMAARIADDKMMRQARSEAMHSLDIGSIVEAAAAKLRRNFEAMLLEETGERALSPLQVKRIDDHLAEFSHMVAR